MSEPFIGQIQLFGFNFPPRGWAFCDGQLLSISQNTALFSLLGTTFGGDGRTTFGLPEMRGRVPVHVGNGPGLSPITWGQRGGQENTTLGVNNLPAHNHQVRCNTGDGNSDEPQDNFLSKAGGGETIYADSQNGAMNSGATANVGGGQSFTNMPPFIGIYYSIAMQGIFPSRN